MIEKIELTYWVKIYLSGPIEIAKQIIRADVFKRGLCVTVDPTEYIYTGGEEQGYVIGLINYPRFPASSDDIWQRAYDLATKLLDGTYQHSALLIAPDKTLWITKRENV